MRGDYRKIKDNHKEIGNNQKKSKFFEKMNEILHDKPSLSPPVILDISVASSSAVESSTDDLEDMAEAEKDEIVSEPTIEKEARKDDGEVANTKEKDDAKPKIAGSKRKKPTKVDKVEIVIEKMCNKISSQQAESDRIFAELEEKRMKMEHEMLKMQQDRQREESKRAERQR